MMRSSPFALASLVLGSGCGGHREHASSRDPVTVIGGQPDPQLDSLADTKAKAGSARRQGVPLNGQILHGETVRPGGSQEFRVRLDSEHCYWFGGATNETGQTITLTVNDPRGAEVAVEKGSSTDALLEYCPATKGVFKLQSKLAHHGQFSVAVYQGSRITPDGADGRDFSLAAGPSTGGADDDADTPGLRDLFRAVSTACDHHPTRRRPEEPFSGHAREGTCWHALDAAVTKANSLCAWLAREGTSHDSRIAVARDQRCQLARNRIWSEIAGPMARIESCRAPQQPDDCDDLIMFYLRSGSARQPPEFFDVDVAGSGPILPAIVANGTTLNNSRVRVDLPVDARAEEARSTISRAMLSLLEMQVGRAIDECVGAATVAACHHVEAVRSSKLMCGSDESARCDREDWQKRLRDRLDAATRAAAPKVDELRWVAVADRCRKPLGADSCDLLENWLAAHPASSHLKDGEAVLRRSEPALDDFAWKSANAEECASPTRLLSCDGVVAYLKRHAHGRHAAQAGAELNRALPTIRQFAELEGQRRAAAEAEQAAERRQQDLLNQQKYLAHRSCLANCVAVCGQSYGDCYTPCELRCP